MLDAKWHIPSFFKDMSADFFKVKCYSYDQSIPILPVTPPPHPLDALDSPTIEYPDLIAGKCSDALSYRKLNPVPTNPFLA